MRDILLWNYSTFTVRGTFNTYRMIPTQILLNTYTEGDESILCTDQTSQSYCGTNGNLRLCKIWYLQYVKNRTHLSGNIFARLVWGKITTTVPSQNVQVSWIMTMYYFKRRSQFIHTVYCDGSRECHTKRNRRMKCKQTEKITQTFALTKTAPPWTQISHHTEKMRYLKYRYNSLFANSLHSN